MQVMPPLLYMLRPFLDNAMRIKLDYGTVAVFSCPNSCLPDGSLDGWAEEFAYLQDPL
jgi:hypothetical protein